MQKWKNKRRILLGISGGIGAYKIPDLVRSWIRYGCEVEIILTEAAENFVAPLTLSTLTGRSVWREKVFFSSDKGWQIPHISLAEWAELFVIAPCTANILHTGACGCAGTLLGAALLAYRGPVLIFPAMNVHMWEHGATQANLNRIKDIGYHVVEPEVGALACGYEGKGRLPDKEVIEAHCWKYLYPDNKSLEGLRVLVTAGPTYEYIDPVRYIGNPSSGKMGYALAEDAWRRGAEVTLVSGPTHLQPPVGVKIVHVTSALEMQSACLEHFDQSQIIIKAAAVGDFRVQRPQPEKIKRDGDITLDLIENPDIAAGLGKVKTDDQFLVGFAAETSDLEQNALKKMKSKKLDMIVANNILDPGAGFAVDSNTVRVFSLSGNMTSLSGSKEEVAEGIWERVIAVRNTNT